MDPGDADGQAAEAPVNEESTAGLLAAEQFASLGELAASVVHEIGAPLTAITVAAEYLLRRQPSGDVNDETAEGLRTILAQAERIGRLTRGLLQLATPTDAVFRPLDLNGRLAETAALLRPHLARERIELEVDLDDAIPPIVCDGHLLHQVVVQLVLNARHALAGSGGTVQIQTRREPGGVRLEVSDTGPGIAPADMPRIFEPFFSRSGGSGMGLPLARRIVHQHGGVLHALNAPGRGARFVVRLPDSGLGPGAGRGGGAPAAGPARPGPVTGR